MTEQKRTGRLPVLDRAQLDAIRDDRRALIDIAADHGVSLTTVQRAKRRGRFKHMHYIPRDEVDSTTPYLKQQVTSGGKNGRPFTRRDGPPSDDEIKAIVADGRSYIAIAKDYKVGTSYIVDIKRKHGAMRRQNTYSMDVLKGIRADNRPPEDAGKIADNYNVPIQVVRNIKGWD